MSLKLRRGLEAQRTGVTPAEGEIIYTTDQKRLFVGDGVTPGGNGVSSPVTSVNSQVGAVVLTTSNVPESGDALNKYFTTSRAQAAITGGAGINVVAGVVSSTITQYTDENARDAINTLLQEGTHTNITVTYDDENDTLSLASTAANDTFKNITVSPNFIFTDLIPGSLYTKTPTIAINRGPGDTTGVGATAQVLLIPASVASIAITNPGSGYSVAPTIQFTGGGDQSVISHATATCTISGGAINTVTITYAGVGYTSLPTIVVGGNAVLTPTLNPTGVNKIEILTSGSGYTEDPVAVISPGSGDSTGYGAEVTVVLSPTIVAVGPTDTLNFSAGRNILLNTTDTGSVVISAKNTGEVLPGAENNLSYYTNTGNAVSGARGLAWLDSTSVFQVGSESQNVNGNLRVVRSNFSAVPGSGISMEQYHTTQDAVNFNFIRGRGTQNSPAAVVNLDKLADISFAGHDGTSAVFGGQITARVDGTPTTGKMPVRLEFYTRNAVDNIASLALTIGSDKTVSFAGCARVANYNTSQRDTLTTPALGMIIYNVQTNKFQGYQNTGGTTPEWVDLS